ncbi:hypothetical protein CC86DRAFT_408584 [Ophiobolus disseminans]|uniref:Uncharacterized protein n=1 Tax=Ophiobolus disseminans TaxID=1469910 RepID=A0A6A6ZUT5_9PLEO|nr:hypothetical protein CC86DRAFT_408584 [Ophiobolus disseminans]
MRTLQKGDKQVVVGKVVPAIQWLRENMLDRFEAWTHGGREHPPTGTLFYRDGIKFDNSAVWTEYEAIRDATKANQTRTIAKPQSFPEMVFGTTTTGPKTYKYYVIANGMDLTQSDLEELTTNLTHTQLSIITAQTAIALPLIWARKLASRTHDYFDDSCVKDGAPLHWEQADAHKVRQ